MWCLSHGSGSVSCLAPKIIEEKMTDWALVAKAIKNSGVKLMLRGLYIDYIVFTNDGWMDNRGLRVYPDFIRDEYMECLPRKNKVKKYLWAYKNFSGQYLIVRGGEFLSEKEIKEKILKPSELIKLVHIEIEVEE
jgi:hypothetical protein